ncbi:MAG TPA: hypothetical protein VMV21_08095 [Vicinamibacteria bacterium]|nr:hypothetical protein [Vicinamibacteria bacterium]
MKSLPVDPERLRKQFPTLTDVDLKAYVEVTGTVLADAATRGKNMAGLMTLAREAREKAAAGQALTAAEERATRYLTAVEKMQGRVATS